MKVRRHSSRAVAAFALPSWMVCLRLAYLHRAWRRRIWVARDRAFVCHEVPQTDGVVFPVSGLRVQACHSG